MNSNSIKEPDDAQVNNKDILDAILHIDKKTEELSNLIKNSQKLDNDTLNYAQSYKELQENFDTLSLQKQKIEQQLKDNIKELENNMQIIKDKENYIKDLEKVNSNLQEQASKYQFALGDATTYQLGDDDNNNSVRLNEDIVHLQDMLEDYVTSLRPPIDIKFKKINELFTKYKCDLEMNSRIKDLSLIKAVLQRHVIETIYDKANKYFEDFKDADEFLLLESEINFKASELIDLMNKFAKTRSESDDVTSAVPIKIRQQIFAALSNHGFSDVINDKQVKNEHEFIDKFKKHLNQEMENYRKISDPKKKKKTEEKASDIIREVVRLFFFRVKTQEPIVKWKWFNNNDKIDPIQMTGSWDEDYVEDATVEICIFPLIYKDSDSSSKLQIYTPAKVFIRDNYHSSSSEEEKEKNKNSKIGTKWRSFKGFIVKGNRSK